MNPRRYLFLFILVLPVVLTPLFVAASILLFYRNDMAQTLLLSLNKPTEIVYFGDSVLRSRSACDTDQRGINDFVAEASGKRVLLVANAAYSSRQYFELSGLFSQTRYQPNTVIIGINLRSFGPSWAGNLAWRHENDMRYVRALQGDAASLFALAADRVVGADQDSDWLDQPLVYAGTSYGTMREISELSVGPPLSVECLSDAARFAPQLRWKFIVQYLFTMEENDEELAFVLATAQRLKAMGIQPLLYLTPVNIVDATTLVGPPADEAIRANAALVKRVIEREGFPVLDLSAALGPEFFADKGCSCEHLQAEGRRFVGERVASQLKLLGP